MPCVQHAQDTSNARNTQSQAEGGCDPCFSLAQVPPRDQRGSAAAERGGAGGVPEKWQGGGRHRSQPNCGACSSLGGGDPEAEAEAADAAVRAELESPLQVFPSGSASLRLLGAFAAVQRWMESVDWEDTEESWVLDIRNAASAIRRRCQEVCRLLWDHSGGGQGPAVAQAAVRRAPLPEALDTWEAPAVRARHAHNCGKPGKGAGAQKGQGEGSAKGAGGRSRRSRGRWGLARGGPRSRGSSGG